MVVNRYLSESMSLETSAERVCYVQCNFCNTNLAVSVPCSNMSLSIVTVRCGHCAKLLSVNVRALLIQTTPHYYNYNYNYHHHNQKQLPSDDDKFKYGGLLGSSSFQSTEPKTPTIHSKSSHVHYIGHG